MARLKEKYINEVVPGLQEKFNYSNVMAIPKLDKVTINIGLGEAVANPKAVDAATKAASFKLFFNFILYFTSPI